MNKSVYTAIDIGSELIKIVSVFYNYENNKIKTLAKTIYPSKGLSRGYIVNTSETTQALNQAFLKHQKKIKMEITDAFFAIGGIGLKSKRFSFSHSIAGSEVTEFDLSKIEEKSKILMNKKISGYILENKPIKYTIDNFEHYSLPLGLEAKKVYTDYFFLSIPKNHLTSLEKVIESSGIIPLEITPAIFPSSLINTTEQERKNGCLLIDIGSETSDILVYKNNQPICLGILPIGSLDITQEIISKEKVDFLTADNEKKGEKFSKSSKIAIEKKVQEIAQEIKTFLEENLTGNEKKILGITLIGGGSKIIGISKIFKKVLGLPIKKNSNLLLDTNTDFSTVYSLIISGIKKEKENSSFSFSKIFSNLFLPFKKLFSKMSL